MKSLILITCLLQTALAAPQLITFKDGKVGVNFLGYHAAAGLGGGQGDGLLGGLHASAGTPWGQNAAAGLGGNVNGRAAGVLYAGAQATPDVGASTVLGGDTSRGGFSGSDAYANGKVASRTRTVVPANTQNSHEVAATHSQIPQQPITESPNSIQKIRPPKKYYSSEAYDLGNSLNNGIALNSNKAKNIDDIEQEKPVAKASDSIVIMKSINKNSFATLNQNEAKFNNAPSFTASNAATESASPLSSSSSSSLNIDASPNNTLTAPAIPNPIHSSVTLGHSLNTDNSNGNIAPGIDDVTGLVITKIRTRQRNNHAHKHNHHHQQHQRRYHQQPKRINLNRQRQLSKTIVKVMAQHPTVEQQQFNDYTEELLPIETGREQQEMYAQISQQQQHPVRRQLIAPAPPPAPISHDAPVPPCDTTRHQCKTVVKQARPDVVQSALQIPIGILQSLQQSFGNFRAT